MKLQFKSIQKDIEESRLAFENAYIRLRGSYTVLLEDIEQRAKIFENSHSTKEDALITTSGRAYIVIGHDVSISFHPEDDGLSIRFYFAELEPKMNPTKKEAEYLEIYRKALDDFLALKWSYAMKENKNAKKLTMIYAAAELEHLKNGRRLVHGPMWSFSEQKLIERNSIDKFNLSCPDLNLCFTI